MSDRLFSACISAAVSLLLLGSLSGCRARTAPALGDETRRNIELVVRAQTNVPATWAVFPENPVPSTIPGYEDLAVRFTSDGQEKRTQKVQFLLSRDHQNLARFAVFPIKDAASPQIKTASLPVYGEKTAPVEIIVFDDLECPYCAQMSARLKADVAGKYRGLARIVVKDFPLQMIHPWATHAAINANCLAKQSSPAYWSFLEEAHERNASISEAGAGKLEQAISMIDALAEKIGQSNGVNSAILKACIDAQAQIQLQDSIREGNLLKIEQTPTLYVAVERLVGLISTKALNASIDRALKFKGINPPSDNE